MKTQPWFESLFSSVQALAAAAHEYQHAARTAELQHEALDLYRVREYDGLVATPDVACTRASDPMRTRRPHDHALMHLHRVTGEQADALRAAYTEAAVTYALGAAWAIRQIVEGEQPPLVVTHELPASPPAFSTLRYSGARVLESARAEVERCLLSGDLAEGIATQDYVSDHEAGTIVALGQTAAGLADAAYAYGDLAQGALSFVLIEPRRQWESERATAHAAARLAAKNGGE